MAAAGLVASCILAVNVAPAVAIDVVGTQPLQCPIELPGDVAVAGSDTVIVGRSSFDSETGLVELAVCRVSPGGATVWARPLRGADPSPRPVISVGTSGIYVGYDGRDATGSVAGHVRRFSPDGTVLESAVIAASGADHIADVAVAPDGRLYVTGTTGGQLGDDPPPPGPSGQTDAFVRAFEANLAVRWTDQFRGTISTVYDPTPRQGYAHGIAIAADATGIYVTGIVVGALPGGPPMLSLDDTFVRRYASSGSLIWSRQFSQAANSQANSHPADLAVSDQGVHVVGQSPGLTDRDPARRQDAYYRLYARDGTVLWTREIGGWNDDGALRVMPDAAGSVLFGHAAEGLGEPGGPATGFLVRFGPTGSVESTFEFSGDGWWFSGSQVASDGAVVRLVSAISVQSTTPTPGLLSLPLGVNLLRIDAVPPLVSPPRLQPRPKSSLGTTSVKLDVSWVVAETASTLASLELQISRDNGPWQPVTLASTATRATTVNARLGGIIQMRARASDSAANVSRWAYSPRTVVAVVQENSTAITQSLSWQRVASASALGGWLDATSRSGAWARYRFSGRSVAWIAPVAPTRGRADVFVDGIRIARIDLWAPTFGSRRIVFQRSWPSSGTHTLEIRNLGTSSRPRIDLDALLILR
jgi:outer membrane protein assembly factor BamB